MLLTSMTYREMYDHLAADKYKVDIKQEYLRPKAIKAFRKTSRFPAWELYEYEVTKRVYFTGNERMLIAHDSNRLRFS